MVMVLQASPRSTRTHAHTMAGWAAYITNLHASSPAIKRSAIVGFPTGEVWARSEDANVFQVRPSERLNTRVR